MGNRLKKLRQQKGVTLDKLSKELKKYGLSLSTGQLSSYENEKRSPRDNSTWEFLAKYFNVPVPYLLGYDDNLTIGDAMKISEAVASGTISPDDEIAKKINDEKKETIKRSQAVAHLAYEKYKDFDLVSNIKVLTLLLENCDNIYTEIIRYVSPRLVQNELTETELKSLTAFINLLEEHGKEFKDTADLFSKRLNADQKTTPTDND